MNVTIVFIASSIYEACKYFSLFQKTPFKGRFALVTSYNPQAQDISKEETGTLIETALSSPEDRADITTTARYHVREHHTYERRVEQIVDALYERNLLR